MFFVQMLKIYSVILITSKQTQFNWDQCVAHDIGIYHGAEYLKYNWVEYKIELYFLELTGGAILRTCSTLENSGP